MELSPRRFTVVLLCFTVAYLLTELAFSSRLLDAAGGVAGIDDIKGLERWGRALSGIALGLVLWTFVPHATVQRAVAGLAAVMAVSIPLMFFIQDRLVESIIDDMKGSQRSDAVILATAISEAVSGYLVIDGLVLPDGAWQSPGGKAFAALFPVLSAQFPVSDQVGVLKRGIREAATSCTPGPQCLGDPASFERRWQEEVRKIKANYKSYDEGSARYAKARADGQARANKEWYGYVDHLRARAGGRSPSQIPSSHWGKVRNEVRQRGNEVPANWRPDDRAGFERPILMKAKREADARFAEETRKAIGAEMPPGLSYASFINHPVIQKRITDALGYDLGRPVPVTEDPTEIRLNLYEVLVERIVDDRLRALRTAREEFSPGGKFEKEGREAAERLVVPPLALLFSLIGGLTHLMKSLYLTMRLLPVPAWSRFLPLYLLPVALLVSLRAVNPVTGSSVYAKLEQGVIAQKGTSTAKALRLIIQAEELVYPLNQTIRKTVLLGQNFGFHAKADARE